LEVLMEAETEKTYCHLDQVERERIGLGLLRGESLRMIAAALGRSPSSISRERQRNGCAAGYIACVAEQSAVKRASVPRRQRKLAAHPDNGIRAFVLAKLRRRRSPEQIAAELKRQYPTEPERWVSHQTIYTSIHILPRGQLKRTLLSCLRHRGKTRLKVGEAKAPRRWIHQLIEHRPEEVADRTIPGNFEGDLLIGKAKSPAAVGVLVERTSRRIWLAKLEARDAFSAYTAFRKKLQSIAAHLRKTLTYDQGSEMAEHARLTDQLGIEVYFCDPHSPWQRAGCENTNGLLRDYLPKGMDMTDLTQAELDKIAFQMNERPRKTLNWRTPNEVWKGILAGKSFQEIVALGT